MAAKANPVKREPWEKPGGSKSILSDDDDDDQKEISPIPLSVARIQRELQGLQKLIEELEGGLSSILRCPEAPEAEKPTKPCGVCGLHLRLIEIEDNVQALQRAVKSIRGRCAL